MVKYRDHCLRLSSLVHAPGSSLLPNSLHAHTTVLPETRNNFWLKFQTDDYSTITLSALLGIYCADTDGPVMGETENFETDVHSTV